MGGTPIHYRYHDANKVTYALEKDGTNMAQSKYFCCFEVPPMFVYENLEAYIAGTYFVRLTKAHTNLDKCIISTTRCTKSFFITKKKTLKIF